MLSDLKKINVNVTKVKTDIIFINCLNVKNKRFGFFFFLIKFVVNYQRNKSTTMNKTKNYIRPICSVPYATYGKVY